MRYIIIWLLSACAVFAQTNVKYALPLVTADSIAWTGVTSVPDSVVQGAFTDDSLGTEMAANEAARDLELQRLKGISLTQNSLLYMYNHNTKLIDDCETTWTAYNAGTIADETTLIKVGSTSQKITADADTKGAYNTVSLDLTKFLDGASSTTDDYIELSLYILTQDITDLGSATIEIAFYDGTNEWTYSILVAALGNGWNHIEIQKSAFVGTADWSAITTIRSYISGTPSAEAIYYLDAIRMTRKDVSASNPNPFQIENDGVMERVFEVSSGTPFLGYDGTTLVVKGLENTNLYSSFTFGDLYIYANILNKIGLDDVALFGQDGTPYDNKSFLYGNKLYAHGFASIAAAPYVSAPLSSNTEMSCYTSISGDIIYTHMNIDGTIYTKSATGSQDSSGGILKITIYADVSLTSFKCSSSPLMVNQ